MRRISLLIVAVTLVGCADKPKPVDPSEDPKNAIVPGSKIYPVTDKMKTEAATLVKKSIPAIGTRATDGTMVETTKIEPGKKGLYYAINKECPCCVTATPFVNKLAADKDLQVVGVLFGTPEEAELWASTNKPSFKVISVSDKAVLDSFGFKAGVYMTLVGSDGRIEKIYPGYSKKTLAEIDPKEDWKDAPDQDTSGCDFANAQIKDNGLGR